MSPGCWLRERVSGAMKTRFFASISPNVTVLSRFVCDDIWRVSFLVPGSVKPLAMDWGNPTPQVIVPTILAFTSIELSGST
ncbi:MAG: hypothetical protein Phyf2KO_17370 [Phycisphaerales bacterium]